MTSPGARDQSAWLTAPTSLIVCSRYSAPGAELIEIATSPTPKTLVMLNWPARNRPIGASIGSRNNDAMSGVSRERRTTR